MLQYVSYILLVIFDLYNISRQNTFFLVTELGKCPNIICNNAKLIVYNIDVLTVPLL